VTKNGAQLITITPVSKGWKNMDIKEVIFTPTN
jgi:hypothetical protein